MPSYSHFQRTNTFSLTFSTVIHFQTISSISVDFYIVSYFVDNDKALRIMTNAMIVNTTIKAMDEK